MDDVGPRLPRSHDLAEQVAELTHDNALLLAECEALRAQNAQLRRTLVASINGESNGRHLCPSCSKRSHDIPFRDNAA